MGLARGGGEARAVAYRFEKQEDHLGAGILGEQLDQLRHPEVGLVADRDELGEAQAPCRAAPAAPASAKPSLKIVATGTPRAPHSSIARSTESPGVMMKAWSIAPGASARLRQARSPSTSLRDALIGTMRPA